MNKLQLSKKIASGDNLKLRFPVVRKVFYTFLHHKKNLFLILPAMAIGIFAAWQITNQLEKIALQPTAPSWPQSKNTPQTFPDLPQQTPPETPVSVSPDSFTPEIPTISKEPLPQLVLTGILASENGNLAIINNQVVETGEEIKGGKVSEITSNKAVVTFGEQKVTLYLQ